MAVGVSLYMHLLSSLFHIVYPRTCFGCGHLIPDADVVCDPCLGAVQPVAARWVPLTQSRVLEVHAIGAYDGVLRKMITAKFRSSLPAAWAMGKLMARHFPNHIFDTDCIVPVPLHWSRYATRGFNQAVEITKCLSRESGVPYASLLMRRSATKFQYKLSHDERRENVENVFSVRPRLTAFQEGQKILLVDDLCTSGATLQAAAKALAPLKPAQIIAIVVARTLA